MGTRYRDSAYNGILVFKIFNLDRYFGGGRMARHEAKHFHHLRIVLSQNPWLVQEMRRYHDTCGLGQCYHYLIKAYNPVFVHAEETEEGFIQGVWVFPARNPWGILPINLAIARLLHDHDPRWTLGGIGRDVNHNDLFVHGELDRHREVPDILENIFPRSLRSIGKPGCYFSQGSVARRRDHPHLLIGLGVVTTERITSQNRGGPPRRSQRAIEAPSSDDSDDDDDDDSEDSSNDEQNYSDEERAAPRRSNRRAPPSEASSDRPAYSDEEPPASQRGHHRALSSEASDDDDSGSEYALGGGGRRAGRGQPNGRSGGPSRRRGGGRSRGGDDDAPPAYGEPEQEPRTRPRARRSARGGRTGL